MSSKEDNAVPSEDGNMLAREAHFQKPSLETAKKHSMESEKQRLRRDEYLRSKWGCTDDMPDSFDPAKLEAALKKRYPGLRRPSVSKREEEVAKDESTCVCACANADQESEGEILDNEASESEAEVDIVTEKIAELLVRKPAICRRQHVPEMLERAPTPRIRAGSKPPLSPSAFVDGGVPCLDPRCGGKCKRSVKSKKHVKAPKYFPFQSGRRS
ncbi:hypothetical protein GGS21DRAFT_491825 [Xylaria nigripes]|nr:hypothetical protein GGS21DRAFT_491825 [Xylaria nigripes]